MISSKNNPGNTQTVLQMNVTKREYLHKLRENSYIRDEILPCVCNISKPSTKE